MHGIRATQFSILVTLIGHGPMTIGDLAEELGLERTTLSRNLGVVESEGWVKVGIAGDDARSRIVTATAKGHKAVTKALPAWREAQEAATAAIGRSGFAALHALAQKAID